ncbi:MAG: xanthine dehydrogenase family protein molybdopterin-binding subunit [Bacteroidales bacterium]|nr:xanthine dehydrogenase family protein molybdopterin-binding subunit [Bacteroidales bacterium]
MKNEKALDQASMPRSSRRRMPRRDFFKILGSGVIVFFLPRCTGDGSPVAVPLERDLTKDYNAFLLVGEDGTVSCYSGKIEMGQGIITSLVQMMADELNVPMEKIKLVLGDTDLCPWDGGTWGSMTTRHFGPSMRAALAEARGVLLQLASEKLKVPANQLTVTDGVISDPANPDKSVTYAELTKGKKIERYLDTKPSVEDYTKFSFVGKSYHRLDAKQKVTGEAKYSGDMKLPGMVFARIVRPPSHGAKLTTVDISDAEKVAGVQIVRDGDLVAALHENRDRAEEAVSRIKAEYSYNELPVNDKTVFEYMLKADSYENVETSTGDIEAGKQLCDKTFDTEIHDPYLAHAPIEPHTALAQFEGGKMTVWASTQTPYPLQDEIAAVLALPLEKVRVIVPFVGGGFGGKSANNQAVEAARLAKLSGKPVMVAFTRDEEFFYDNFHPAGVIRIKSGIDKSGLIKLWDYHAYYCGTRGTEILYDVPNLKLTDHGDKENSPSVHPFATGPWRAPNNNTNTFARETQIDIMAAAAGIDPLEFRLKNLKDEKMIEVLKKVADMFGYKPGKGKGGRGVGLAIGTDVGALVAQMAEVEVDRKTGKVKVLRIVCAQDMGLCVNPLGATMQMEGCMTMGLGYTLTEELAYEGGNIITRGYDSYEIPRFSWLPKIETFIFERMNEPPQGGGEPAIITVGAVVGNAIFNATGARMYRMPFTPARVLDAIKKV